MRWPQDLQPRLSLTHGLRTTSLWLGLIALMLVRVVSSLWTPMGIMVDIDLRTWLQRLAHRLYNIQINLPALMTSLLNPWMNPFSSLQKWISQFFMYLQIWLSFQSGMWIQSIYSWHVSPKHRKQGPEMDWNQETGTRVGLKTGLKTLVCKWAQVDWNIFQHSCKI